MVVIFFCRYVTLFFNFAEKSRVHMHHAAIRQSIKIPFFVWSLRFLYTDIFHKLTRQKREGGGAVKGAFPLWQLLLIFISLVEDNPTVYMFPRIGLRWRGVAWKHLFRISSVLILLKYLLVLSVNFIVNNININETDSTVLVNNVYTCFTTFTTANTLKFSIHRILQ